MAHPSSSTSSARGRPRSGLGVAVVPGPQVDGYILTERLGSGSYAAVYKAFRKDAVGCVSSEGSAGVGAREVVAIKCIQRSKLRTKMANDNLIREIEILKSLKHEFIVEMKDFQWDSYYIYLIMEFCSGGDLSNFIQSKRTLSETTARRFLQQLACALKFLRSRDISHMDLKPQNLLLKLSDPNTQVLKVADFGFAMHLDPESQTNALRGSPLYMAPEMFSEEGPCFDARVDLWSVGVILYEALFGQAPFASKTFEELGAKILDHRDVRIPLGVKVSDSCHDLLATLLQRDPDKRLTFDEFFQHPFIDLEHMPSAECYTKAFNKVSEAVSEDTAGRFEEASALYTAAFEYFIPAIQFETNREKKNLLRTKTQQYMLRAEEINKLTTLPGLVRQVSSLDRLQELRKMYAANTTVIAALDMADHAESLDGRTQFPRALSYYQSTLEQLMPVLRDEQKGLSKTILNQEVERIMKRAEEIKSFIKLRTNQTSLSAESDQLGQSRSTSNQGCCIQ